MAKKEKIYKRMPGRPFSPIGVSSLWHAADHLLLVKSAFFRERYKRFYYKDIQAVVMHRTGMHWVWTFVWGGIALLFGIIAVLVPGTPYVSGSILALSLIALLMNLSRGACCQVYLQTAVQRQLLTSLKRVRTAGKTMDRIKAFVDEHQGAWEKQKSLGALKKQTGSSPSGLEGVPVTTAHEPAETVPAGPYNPLLHRILFGALSAMGALGVIQIVLKNLPLGLLGALMHGIVQILVIVALARWYHHLKGTTIAKVNWLALILVSFYSVVGYILYLAITFRYPEINYHHWAMFKRMFELQMTEHPVALSGNILYAGGSLLLGVLGMQVLQRNIKQAGSQ